VFFLSGVRLAGEPLGGEAEAEQARDAPRAVSVQGARSDFMPGLCVVLICVCDFGDFGLCIGDSSVAVAVVCMRELISPCVVDLSMCRIKVLYTSYDLFCEKYVMIFSET